MAEQRSQELCLLLDVLLLVDERQSLTSEQWVGLAEAFYGNPMMKTLPSTNKQRNRRYEHLVSQVPLVDKACKFHHDFASETCFLAVPMLLQMVHH
jgi:hypothetical protein